jgi:hypothetical protein
MEGFRERARWLELRGGGVKLSTLCEEVPVESRPPITSSRARSATTASPDGGDGNRFDSTLAVRLAGGVAVRVVVEVEDVEAAGVAPPCDDTARTVITASAAKATIPRTPARRRRRVLGLT